MADRRAEVLALPLRINNDAQVVRLPWTFFRLFTGRYAIQSGRAVFDPRWKRARMDAIIDQQRIRPVSVARVKRRVLWYFTDSFYWDDEGYKADDVKALVLKRQRRRDQELRAAHSMMRAEETGRPRREPINDELRRAVYERDGGRCVQCDSAFNLQYDHVLPVALGGATTLENLQLLCADCNRRKSDSL
jgi:5-methylcytosine-specific restriction endonuclease McrA